LLGKAAWFREQGDGYFKEHNTNPQTIGYSLADSPVGLLAWIYEKLHHWTDDYQWDDDEGMLHTFFRMGSDLTTRITVLEWISIYWFSRAGPTASTRIYFEVYQSMKNAGTFPKTTIPMGVSYFPVEIGYARPS